ncbi:MAG: DNA recombination protein RmuC [Gaiella sp.]|uniref:DNA recombination protein RmuC n=1 Tax=Gaiella sp. TaxID=2663207 RepID=UPI003C72D619
MTIVALLIGLVAGLALGVTGVLFALRERMQSGTGALARTSELEVEARGFERRAIEAEAQLAAERGSLDERVAGAVRAASTAAMKESSGAFLDLAQTKLDAYVAPLRESLGKVETQVNALESARKEAYGSLTEAVRSLREDQLRLRSETNNLVTALRAPHVRGRWGEIQLRRVVELAGMVQHCDFVEQPTTDDGEGRVLRPDVLVNLPGGKCIVVDSKAPLAAYLDAFATDVTDEARQAALRDHARQVREHIVKLGQKAYWRQFDATPEFVVMFLPDESFLRAALEHDPTLVEFAADNHVITASPTNLIGLLRAVHYGWQQETIAEGARQISDLGRELYKRLSTMGTHFSKLGRSLDTAVRSFNETVGSLERQVLPQARRFEQHGITGIAPPELTPIERQTRVISAPELVGEGEQAELLPGEAHAA